MKYVAKRPYLDEFLTEMQKHFEILIFTAGTKDYADQVIDKIDAKKQLISHRLYRNHCTDLNNMYLKDLSKIGRPAKDTILVDNSIYSLILQRN